LADGQVQEVLATWPLPPVDLWALFPGSRQPSARARAFVAFVGARLKME
jgi:DNA-binding transcriptional LysR family regulator